MINLIKRIEMNISKSKKMKGLLLCIQKKNKSENNNNFNWQSAFSRAHMTSSPSRGIKENHRRRKNVEKRSKSYQRDSWRKISTERANRRKKAAKNKKTNLSVGECANQSTSYENGPVFTFPRRKRHRKNILRIRIYMRNMEGKRTIFMHLIHLKFMNQNSNHQPNSLTHFN